MPRCARVKSIDSVYHIMVRSLSDTLLYRCSEDMDKYLELIKKYQGTFLFEVYAYCVMDNHAHIIIDAQGADISRIMHGINQSYAQYYNRKYNRRGHLFQDRFKSKIIFDDRYLITLSAYIHNNAKDIKNYENKIEKYKYSSLGIYIGTMKDRLSIVDKDFILNQFSKDTIEARKLYIEFIHKSNGEEPCDDIEFRHERAEYRSERRTLIRNYTPVQVVNFVSDYTKLDKSYINIKYTKKNGDLKALSALLMKGVCDMKEKDICAFMGNISQSQTSKLCLKGIDLMSKRDEYKGIIRDFIGCKVG